MASLVAGLLRPKSPVNRNPLRGVPRDLVPPPGVGPGRPRVGKAGEVWRVSERAIGVRWGQAVPSHLDGRTNARNGRIRGRGAAPPEGLLRPDLWCAMWWRKRPV